MKKRIYGRESIENNTKKLEKDGIMEWFSLFKVFYASFCQHWKASGFEMGNDRSGSLK